MSVLNNLNYIKSVSVYPCALPGPWVLIETAFEAGVPVLLELESWSCLDIIKLRAGISYRCGRKLAAIIKAAHGAQAIDEIHFLYKFVAPIERALWWWFVADMVSDFVAHWTSLVYQSQGCFIGPHMGAAQSDWLVTGVYEANRITSPIFFFSHHTGDINPVAPLGFIVPRGWYFSVFFNVGVKPIFSAQSTNLELWIEETSPSHVVFGGNKYPDGALDAEVRGTYKLSHQAPMGAAFIQYRFMMRPSALVVTTEGKAMIQISRDPILADTPIGAGCFRKDWSVVRDPHPRT